MINTAKKALSALLLLSLFFIAIPALDGCRNSREAQRERERGTGREEDDDEEREHSPPAPPPPWGDGIEVRGFESSSDTVSFHIGSPLFLHMHVTSARGCIPGIGTPFYFDASGAQLGWGFEEVTDTLLFPRSAERCSRTIMLSSENSNRIAEGIYSFKVMIFLDANSRLYSDTIVLRAVRTSGGADSSSYSRFLQEQIVRNNPMLSDGETLRAIFADGTPRSAESEIYRALILFRGGNRNEAEKALKSSEELERRRGQPLMAPADAARDNLQRLIRADATR